MDGDKKDEEAKQEEPEPEVVFCANCDAEAVCRVTHPENHPACEGGTPLCFTCKTAYEWGQVSPDADFEDIDQPDDDDAEDELGHQLDEDGDPIHQFGPFETARFTGNAVRHCQVPGCRAMSMDGDEPDDVVGGFETVDILREAVLENIKDGNIDRSEVIS